MSEEEERKLLKDEYLMVIYPLAPDASEEEKQLVLKEREMLAANLNLDNCNIGHLRYLVGCDYAA